MSGPEVRDEYTADDAVVYALKVPTWVQNVADTGATVGQTIVAATTQANLPKGIRPRKRYYRITATGKEGSFHVLSAASTIWTAPIGTPVLIPLFNSAVVANNATLRGRTGERTKAI